MSEVGTTQRQYMIQLENSKENLLMMNKPELQGYDKSASISYSGKKRTMKKLQKIAQDLYLFYGVTEADIRNKSERYSSLAAVLSL